jgi:hypothetical protein
MRLPASAFALIVQLSLVVSVSAAQSVPSSLEASQSNDTKSSAPTAVANAVTPARVHIPEGTEVPLLMVDQISSETNAEGDRFTLRVDGDVKVGGIVAIKSGTIAVGVVTNAHKRGFMGKAGELNINLDHLNVGDDRVKLRGSKGRTGDAKVGTTVALVVLFGPIGLLKRGHDIEIKPGTPITAYVDQSTDVLAP